MSIDTMSIELMSVLLAVVAVGATLAGLLLTGQRAIRTELAAQRRDFSTELAAQRRDFSAELAAQRQEFSARRPAPGISRPAPGIQRRTDCLAPRIWRAVYGSGAANRRAARAHGPPGRLAGRPARGHRHPAGRRVTAARRRRLQNQPLPAGSLLAMVGFIFRLRILRKRRVSFPEHTP